jgi:hypothetical protein
MPITIKSGYFQGDIGTVAESELPNLFLSIDADILKFYALQYHDRAADSGAVVVQTKPIVDGYNIYVYVQSILPKRMYEIMGEIEEKLPVKLDNGAPKFFQEILPFLETMMNRTKPGTN